MEMVLKFSSRDFEKRDGLSKAFTHAGEQQIVSINGVEQAFMIVCTERSPSFTFAYNHERGYSSDCEHTVTLQSVEKAKSKQEIEAEEAVEKAKQSLKSAKKVLQSVKGV